MIRFCVLHKYICVYIYNEVYKINIYIYFYWFIFEQSDFCSDLLLINNKHK